MSADAIRQRLLVKFREVTGDRVERLQAALLSVEGGVGEEPLQEVARELHTLKGEARLMGFSALSRIVHLAEDLLPSLSGGASPALQAVQKACDSIPFLLDEDPGGGELAERLRRELESLVGNGSPAAAAAPAPPAVEPPAQPKEIPPPPPSQPAAVKQEAPRPQRPQQAGSIRVHLDALDEIAGLAGDVMVEGARSGRRVLELRSLLEGWTSLSDRLLAVAEGTGRSDLIAEVEDEIHALRTEAFRFYHRHAESVGDVRTLLGNLAERVATARLIPLSGIFAGLPGAARQLAREHGKEVECTIAGGDTGVDKSILPSLNDPLIHLLRNSIDHGIETPEERVAAGKPPVGSLRITARPDGDRLQVILEDDGRGIDPEKVRAIAVERRVVSATEAAGMSRASVIDLIFQSGLSTRQTASEISGRGVGLDVVRKKVTSLGGTVAVESEQGIGTRFTLRLPQSVSLMKVLLFRIDDDVYGLPAVDVEGVGRIDPSGILEIAGVRTVRMQDRFLPIVPLGPLLALNGGPSGKNPPAVFVRQGNQGVALVVDGFVGDREVAVKAPSAFLRGLRYVSGAAALEDGKVALLLSSADLIASARAFGAHAQGQKARRRLRVLLADDSLIARESEAALLRAQGHEVDEAGDGEEAWQKLQVGSYDLLVTDVQMPVLDGIQLTRRVKESRLQRLPVIILSSLSAPQDLRRGAEAGADAYIGKSELDGEKLASTIERLCGTSG